MVSFEYGPVEVYIVRYAGDLPDAAVLGALTDLIASDTVRLLDIALVGRDLDGTVRVREIDDVTETGTGGPVELEARGLTATEDIDLVAADLEPGMSGAVVVVELLWAKALAERFAESGSELIGTVRIPAPALNDLAAAAHIGQEQTS